MFWADQFDEDRVCLLAPEGRLSRADLINLGDRLRGLAARGVFQVVVDTRAVEHWDFRGLTSVADAVDHRRRSGASTAFITPNSYLRDIAAAAGVSGRLEFYDDVRWTGGFRPTVVPGLDDRDEPRRAVAP